MPSFDVVSEVDLQEVRNAVDQARREIATRFDFKGTDTAVELADNEITVVSVTRDRLDAARQVVEEKLVRRKVSLKALEWGRVVDAAGGTVRQVGGISAGISSERARAINRHVKELGLKGVQTQTLGDQVRVSAKKRDVLQEVMGSLREADFGVPLQFKNLRD